VHVCTDRNGRALKPPADLRQLFRKLEQIQRGSQ
jgi:hypothetical protein